MAGSATSTVQAGSLLPFINAGNGTVPTPALGMSYGTFTANGASSVTVTDAGVTASSILIFTLQTVGGTVSPNALNVKTITAGTGFTVAGTASDTSVYGYLRIG